MNYNYLKDYSRINEDFNLEMFLSQNYKLDSNLDLSQGLTDTLNQVNVIFLGETHHNPIHQELNGSIINALWTPNSELFTEHEPMGADGQLAYVKSHIAETAQQWDYTESKTSLIFDKLVWLSNYIKDDFRKVNFSSTKDLLKKATRLIDEYLIHSTSVEEAWTFLDHQIDRIRDETSKEHVQLMLKQGYLRVWALAAFETIDRFLTSLEEEMEERNGWMAKKIAQALHKDKKERVFIIAGSEHFTETITNVKKKQVKNPIFKSLNYLLLIPLHDEIVEEVKHISEELVNLTEADTTALENEALHLCQQSDLLEQYLQEMEELKKLFQEIIQETTIDTHQKALNSLYMTGAISLRVDKIAKTIQIWNIMAELALVNKKWFTQCRDILFG